MAGKANSKLFGLLIPLSTSICFQKGCGPRPGVPPDSSCPQRKLTHVSAHIAWSTYTNKIRLYGQLGACWKYLYFFTLRNTDILTTSPWEKLKLVERLSETSSANFYYHFRPAFSYSFVNWLRLADPDKLDKSVSSDKNPDLYPEPLYLLTATWPSRHFTEAD